MKLTRRGVLSGGAAAFVSGCAGARYGANGEAGVPVTFETFDPTFERIVDRTVTPRLLGEGYWWAEGPAWDRDRQQLYFTDVPQNRAFRWMEGQAVDVFQDPSGVAPDQAQGMREPGANGLLQARNGDLLICNHGRRAVERMNLETGERTTIVDRFEGKRFNSPNDIIEASDGALYFTDPPYGLEGLNASPMKEMAVNGVYRVDSNGAIARIISDMTFPNGVALSPDEKTLFVAQSDPEAPLIRKLSLDGRESDASVNGELWFDARPFMDGHEGLPDGMAVTNDGHVFLAGPGGVLVIDQDAKCLGRIATGRATANCAFGEDGRTLFITAKDRLLAVRTAVTGMGQFSE